MLKLCLVIIAIFYIAAAALSISKLRGKDKSVNLALETVFEFDDKKKDVNMLNKVQKFIDNMKNAIENNKEVGRRHMRHSNRKFTNLIVDLIHTLVRYDDRDLESFAFIICDEIKNLIYDNDYKFYGLKDNKNLRKFLTKKLKEFAHKPAANLRSDLQVFANKLGDKEYVKKEKALWEIINFVYKDDSISKFKLFITDLDDYRLKTRKNIDLSQIIRGGLAQVLFNPYSQMNSFLRSMLMVKLRNLLQYYNINILFKPPEDMTDIHNTTDLTTLMPIMVEKNVNLNDIKQNYDKWLNEIKSKSHATTYRTKHPSIPTTENTANKKHLKHRFKIVKTRTNKVATSTYKSQEMKGTVELRTLRQMYVEKNLDLKYNHIVDDEPSTDTTRYTKTVRHFNLPTTRKSHRHKHNNIFVTKALNYDMEPEFRNRNENERVPKHKHETKIVKRGRNNEAEYYTIEPERPNVIKMVKDFDYNIEVRKGRDLELLDQKLDEKNSRHKKQHNRKDNLKVSKDESDWQKTTKLKVASIPIWRRQNRESLSANLNTNRGPLILHRRYETPPNIGARVYRRRLTQAPTFYQEGLSIEGFRPINPIKNNYRRNNNPVTVVSIDSNNHVMKRIQKLENDLDMLKTQVKTDENIEVLRNNNNLVTHIKSTKDINFKPGNNVNSIIKTQASSSNKFGMEIPTTNKNTATQQWFNKNEERHTIEQRFDTLNSKIEVNNLPLVATLVPKEISIVEANTNLQARKAFLNLNQREVIQSDNEKLNEKNDSNYLNTENNKPINHSSRENIIIKTTKTASENEINTMKSTTETNKYSSIVTSFRNDKFDNQNKTELYKSLNDVRERAFEDRNNDYQVKKNVSEDYSKVTETELQLSSTKALERGNYGDVINRAKNDETLYLPNNTCANTTNLGHRSNANEEFAKRNVITKDNTFQQTQTTEGNPSDLKTISCKQPYNPLHKLVQETGEEFAGLSNTNHSKLI